MLNSLATIVHTPPKCVGRWAPQSFSDRPSTLTTVRCPWGYICSALGKKTASTAVSRQSAKSCCSCLGYLLRSSPGPNCVWFRNMLTTTKSVSFRACLIRLICPSCSAPSVGTNPTVCLACRAVLTRRRISFIVRAIFIDSSGQFWHSHHQLPE